jgi:superoxide dismutase
LDDLYVYGFRNSMEACKQIINWCSMRIKYLSFLKKYMELPEGHDNTLDHWGAAFADLENKARIALDSRDVELSNPLVTQLLHQVLNTDTEFIGFIQGDNLQHEDQRKMNLHNPVPIGGHTLPPLPYNYDALEPYIDEKTMRIHHDKHHKGYVEGLNKAEEMMAKARKTGDFELIAHWEREAAFNGAGHYLHTIFWNNMSPKGGGDPTGSLNTQITKDFGSFSRFKKHFSSAAEKVEAVGWAILVWAPRAHRLEILQAEKHQNLSQWDVIPLLVLDVWEHAYYLKYQNDRKSYIDSWWNVVHWDYVNQRLEKAETLTWKPY